MTKRDTDGATKPTIQEKLRNASTPYALLADLERDNPQLFRFITELMKLHLYVDTGYGDQYEPSFEGFYVLPLLSNVLGWNLSEEVLETVENALPKLLED